MREIQLSQEAKRWGLSCWSRDGSGADSGAEQTDVFSPAEQTWCTGGWGTVVFVMSGDGKFVILFQDPQLLVWAYLST